MYHSLTNSDYVQQLLKKHAISPTRSAGQNFLVCEEPVEAVLTALEDAPRRVTELGAGMGPLTQALLSAGFFVRAIERDTALADILASVVGKRFPEQLGLVRGDLREAEWTQAEPYALVGNIPYQLSGYIMRRLVTLEPAPTQAVLMVQREVGARLAAIAGEMNLLGLAAQLWGTPHLLLNVPRTCFWPEPAVHSVIVLLIPREKDIPLVERENVLRVATVFFQQKRKQIGGVLKRSFHQSVDEIETILGPLNLTATARPQDLSVAQWQALTKVVAR